MIKKEYFDDGKSGSCCWDFSFAIGYGIEEEDGYYTIRKAGHPIYCCPFCGSKDFKNNPRMGKEE